MAVSYVLSIVRSGLGVITSRIFGLARDIIVAAVYGATGVTDMFFVAFAIPNLFRQFFAEGAISSAFIPFLSDKTQREGIKSANNYLTQLIIIQSLLITLLTLILIILAPYVIMLFMPGYIGEQDNIILGATLLRIIMPYLLFVGISGLFAGHLNLHGSYFMGYASTSAVNAIMIIGAIIGYYQNANIYTLAVSVFIGGVVQVCTIYAYARHKEFRFGTLKPLDPDIKRTYKLLLPSLAGVGISQMNFLVGRIIASFLQHGSISWLFYANRLFQFPLGVFSVTISTVSLTELSKAKTNNDCEKVTKIIDKSIIALLLIIIPSTIGLVALSQEITELIFSRNAFTENDAVNTARALEMYSIGLLFYSFVAVFTRVYHSDKNTKTPVKAAAVGFVVNVALNIILMKPMGHAGIALSSSIAALINSTLLYIGIKGYNFDFRANAKTLLKILVATYIMSGLLIVGKMYHVHVLFIIAICSLAYISSLMLMKIKFRELFR